MVMSVWLIFGSEHEIAWTSTIKQDSCTALPPAKSTWIDNHKQSMIASWTVRVHEPSNLLHQHWPNKHFIEVVGWSIMFSSQSLWYFHVFSSHIYIIFKPICLSYVNHYPLVIWHNIHNYRTQPISMILPIQHHVFHSYREYVGWRMLNHVEPVEPNLMFQSRASSTDSYRFLRASMWLTSGVLA